MLPRQLSSLASLIPASVDTAWEVAELPRHMVIIATLPDTQTSLELRIRNMLEEL